jgi:hypothetical protein
VRRKMVANGRRQIDALPIRHTFLHSEMYRSAQLLTRKQAR